MDFPNNKPPDADDQEIRVARQHAALIERLRVQALAELVHLPVEDTLVVLRALAKRLSEET